MRIEDISPREDTMTRSLGRDLQSISGKGLCVTVSADGTRAYLGGHSGVWRSDDGGETWWHPEWQPANLGGATLPGALMVPNVYDLLIHPANNDIVFAATGRDARKPAESGIYRSTDGALTWARVHQFTRGSGGNKQVGMVGRLASATARSRHIFFAAGEFAVGRSTDGATWTESSPEPDPSRNIGHVVAGPQWGRSRRVYAVGSRVWYSLDGGITWHLDPVMLSLGLATDGAGASSRALAIHPTNPNVIYLAQGDLTFWRGEYPAALSTAPGVWTKIPAPPFNYPTVTDSGGAFIIPHMTTEGELFFFASDRRTVHIALGEPVVTEGWTRVEDSNCHLDPHGLSLTPDFHPWSPDIEVPGFGRAVLVNDGGINFSTNGLQNWSNGRGLSTLGIVNIAINTVPAQPAAICLGCGDNFGFTSPDGGATWKTQNYLGGDNDCAFADPRQPNRMIVFAPRSKSTPPAANNVFGEIYLYVGADGSPPDTALGTSVLQRIPGPPPVPGTQRAGWNAVSNFVNWGYRPLILTRAGETPRPDGDLVTIRFTGTEALLLRTTALNSITVNTDWVTTANSEGPGVKCFQVGPPLPNSGVNVVQASGGHAAPTFYVGDPNGAMQLWKLVLPVATPRARRSHGGFGPTWRQLVPARGAPGTVPTIARRWFVDPYRVNLVNVLGSDHIYRSDDGGETWVVDGSLEGALSESGAFPFDIPNDGNPDEALLRDMQFAPRHGEWRYALGPAGIFHTLDGKHWSALVRSSALAMRPNNCVYEDNGCERSLYVATSNRGILRLAGLPPDWEFPIGSLQAAVGRITLLRVHDIGTGYGPPYDQIDADVIVCLDSEPDKAFGFQLRADLEISAARGKLKLLRDCFNTGRPIRLEFIRTGCRSGRIIRVIETA
jgi:photosystem II stability/assembly factor-like uncharacterized protein